MNLFESRRRDHQRAQAGDGNDSEGDDAEGVFPLRQARRVVERSPETLADRAPIR